MRLTSKVDDFISQFDGPREQVMRRAQEMGFAFADLDRITPDPAALIAIPRSRGERFRVLPIKRESGVIWVAVGKQPIANADELSKEIGLKVMQVFSLQSATEHAFAHGAWWGFAE